MQSPGWTPYRFGFNNPLTYADPLGLFETKDAAKKYKKKHNVKGRVKKNVDRVENGGKRVTYSIDHKGNNTRVFDGGDDVGIIDGTLVDVTASSITSGGSSEQGFAEKSAPLSAGLSAFFTTAGELQHSDKFKVFNKTYSLGVWRGQNGSFYSQSAAAGKSRPFYGNQHTGSVNRAAAAARPIKIAGTVIGIYNYAGIVEGYHNGNLSGDRAIGEGVGNTISTFTGIYGVFFYGGWEGGRAISNSQGYQNWKRDKWLPYRFKTLGY